MKVFTIFISYAFRTFYANSYKDQNVVYFAWNFQKHIGSVRGISLYEDKTCMVEFGDFFKKVKKVLCVKSDFNNWKAKKKPPLSIIGCIWKYNTHITIEPNSLANLFTIPDTFHAKFQKIAQNILRLPTFSWDF